MCARYSVTKDLAEFAKFFNFVCRVAFFAPRYRPVFTHGGSGWPLVSGAKGSISSPTI